MVPNECKKYFSNMTYNTMCSTTANNNDSGQTDSHSGRQRELEHETDRRIVFIGANV